MNDDELADKIIIYMIDQNMLEHKKQGELTITEFGKNIQRILAHVIEVDGLK